MNRSAVEQSLQNIKKYFSKKIMTTNTHFDANTISWDSYKRGIIRGVCYPREYQILLNERQYSYLMKDRSFFQFYFKFSNDELCSCRMAYYPVPKLIDEAVEVLLEYEETADIWLKEVFLEMAHEMENDSGYLSSNSHVRFDYDKSATSHSKSHLQFGGINDFRIAAKKLVLPFAFAEKILLDFHKEWFNGDLDINKTKPARIHSISNCYEFEENDIYFITS